MSGIIGVSPNMRSGLIAEPPVDHIIQIISANKDDTYEHSSTSWTAVPDLSVTIYPKFKGSKIMLYASVLMGAHDAFGTFGAFRIALSLDNAGYNGVNVGETRGSNRQRATGWIQAPSADDVYLCGTNFLYGPTNSDKLIFRVETLAQQGGYKVQVNRQGSDGDAQYNATGSSNITVMEVSG